jgi:cation diffusion facilitator CzcD-associated flavoprotein CzcO
MSEPGDVLVIGAGPAGLAVTACLRRRGIDSVVVDKNEAVGDSWRWRYDRLHLHTPRVQSHLPGLRIPAKFGRWVARDDFITYLAGYARYHRIEPRLGVEIQRLTRDDDRWVAATTDGDIAARQVVVATGYNHTPHLPDWPGHEGFSGELLHAATYRNAHPYVGRDVLVVGTGNTGAEIAADLAEQGAGRVRISVRTPPNVIPRDVAGVPTTLVGIPNDRAPALAVDPGIKVLQRLTIGDLTEYGMPAPERGVVEQFRETDVVPLIDVGLVEQLKAGRVQPVAAVTGFDGPSVLLADGTRIEPEVVIAATGYERGLDGLLGGLGILDDRGRPAVHGAATHPAAPRLRFIGLTNPLKGLLLQINIDSRLVARAVAHELRTG